MTINEFGPDRSAQQAVRHHKALIQRFKRTMRDRAKLMILAYMEGNPAWTPEDLQHITKMAIRTYGLNNRYVPDLPKAEVEAEAGGKVEHADAPGTEEPVG